MRSALYRLGLSFATARCLAIVGGVFVAFCLPLPAMADDSAADARFFQTRIEPVLRARCYECHSAAAGEGEGELRLDSPSRLARGGDRGPVIDRQNVDASLLIKAIRRQDGLEMPPDGPPLEAPIVADFVTWIQQGAPDPRAEPDAATSPAADARGHWAFQPVERPSLPTVRDRSWLLTPVDAFVLAKLEAHGWRPASPATRGDWIRRVTFDLIGLPPTPDEVEAFVSDPSPRAWEHVVDRLLGSPHYGERWAQHWLDVVRYAETEGFEYDRTVPGAWRYRDYVIRSFNADKPFDQFVTEQVAGDELGADDPELLAASVLHRLGPVRRNAGNPDIALSRNEVLTERTNVLGESFLGLTVGCARCHNHKLEPISQRDYYSLQAYLAATEDHDTLLVPPAQAREYEAAVERNKQQTRQLRERLQEVSGDEKTRLKQQLADLQRQLPPAPPTIPGTRNNFEQRTAIHVLRRGVWENKGDQVGPRPLSVLVPDDLAALDPAAPSPRTELARWLTDPRHPLTARVIVNRLWQHHFGRGIVATPNDFGTHGAAPSYRELLDWLASELVANGWQLKHLQRAIVLSNTYRQAAVSAEAETYSRSDPENRLLWRFPRRRLSAEELRDAMLAVAGVLNRRMGGESVITPVDPQLVELLYQPAQWTVTPEWHEHDRRSIYLLAKRNLRLPFMEVFDAPTLLVSCPRRESSTHAPQALELLNGPLANQLAAAFGQRLEQSGGDNPAQLVQDAFRLALGRAPSANERELALQFLRQQPTREFALALFNLNEFVYVK